MKKNISIICLLFLSLASYSGLYAQQAFTYTQYMNNVTPMMPAYSLLDRSPALSLMTRRQWVGIEGAPRTSLFTTTLPLPDMKAAAGMFVALDEVGVEKRTEVNFLFAKAVQLSAHHFFSASVNGGFHTYKASYAALDPTDQSYRDDLKETTAIVGLSLMLYDPDKFYIGISLPRASVRALGSAAPEDKRNWKNAWYISGGYLTPLNEAFVLKPAALISYSKDQKTQADLSATLYWMEQLGIGINYRTSQEVAGMISYSHKHRLTASYSYQVAGNSDEVSGMSNGSHEVTLRYRFGKDLLPKLL